jgi:hypothetical protein
MLLHTHTHTHSIYTGAACECCPKPPVPPRCQCWRALWTAVVLYNFFALDPRTGGSTEGAWTEARSSCPKSRLCTSQASSSPASLVILHAKLLEGMIAVLLHVRDRHILALSRCACHGAVDPCCLCPFVCYSTFLLGLPPSKAGRCTKRTKATRCSLQASMRVRTLQSS